MKAVLLSIRPEWVDLMDAGYKTVEVRKTRPKLETPFKCYLYLTKDKRRMIRCNYDGRGKVVGEFICDDIDFVWNCAGTFGWKYKINDTCLSMGEVIDYSKRKNVKHGSIYCWHISNLKIYGEPKELEEFRKPAILVSGTRETESGGVAFFDGYKEEKITRPPQSWRYVEEIK